MFISIKKKISSTFVTGKVGVAHRHRYYVTPTYSTIWAYGTHAHPYHPAINPPFPTVPRETSAARPRHPYPAPNSYIQSAGVAFATLPRPGPGYIPPTPSQPPNGAHHAISHPNHPHPDRRLAQQPGVYRPHVGGAPTRWITLHREPDHTQPGLAPSQCERGQGTPCALHLGAWCQGPPPPSRAWPPRHGPWRERISWDVDRP